MGLYYNGKKVRNLYYNGKCITRLARGKEMTRLVEGDDFVRAEWLVGRNGAYIDTAYKMQIFDDAFQIKARINDPTEANPDGGEQDLFGAMNNSGDRCICFYQRNFGRLCFAYSNIQNGGNQVFFVNKNIFDATMYADQSYFFVTCNGETLSQTVGTLSALDNRNIALFQLTTGKSNNYFHGDIAYFRITNPTFSIDRVNMTPVRLLRPIPATLDGNGIARNAGECGMYDSVSGKFYGNVANGGTFTVEPSLVEGVDYQRYKWLVGDGAAYIDTGVTDLSVSDYIRTIFDDSSNIGVSIRTWGREGSRLIVGNDGSPTSLKVWGTSSSFVYNNDGIYIYDMYFDLLNDKVTVNNQIFTLSLPHDNGLSFLLFARHFNTSPSRVDSINWAKYKSFEIHNQLNLVPCRLLRPIPATLDANGIARNAGECGMFDAVSGKFYGNVGSGAFTVSDN